MHNQVPQAQQQVPFPGTYIWTRFGYAQESLPLVEVVTPSICRAILEGKDINLASLLVAQSSVTHSEHAMQEKSDSRLSRLLTIQEFITTFGIFKSIMCYQF